MVATIKGTEKPSTFFDNFTAFLLAIDGKRVMAGRKGWNVPLVIAAGHHTITTEFNRSVYVARTEIDFDAAKGTAYEVRFEGDVALYAGHTYVDFWIVNIASGKPVSAIKRGSMSGGSSSTFIPIIIPRR